MNFELYFWQVLRHGPFTIKLDFCQDLDVEMCYNLFMAEAGLPPRPETPRPVVETGGLDIEKEVAQPAGERTAEASPIEVQPITPPANPQQILPTAPNEPPLQHQVEEIMSAGLTDAYQAMDPGTQQKFKQVGEATAVTIAGLLARTKIEIKKIIELIFGWLRLIPGVSNYYLEQEAKIKADRLVSLSRPPRK